MSTTKDNRYTLTIQLPKDAELDAAISKVIEERLLAIIRSEVSTKLNEYIYSKIEEVFQSQLTPTRIFEMAKDRINNHVSSAFTYNRSLTKLIEEITKDRIDARISAQEKSLIEYSEYVIKTEVQDNLRAIVSECVVGILGTSIQADVVKAVVDSLTKKE